MAILLLAPNCFSAWPHDVSPDSPYIYGHGPRRTSALAFGSTISKSPPPAPPDLRTWLHATSSVQFLTSGVAPHAKPDSRWLPKATWWPRPGVHRHPSRMTFQSYSQDAAHGAKTPSRPMCRSPVSIDGADQVLANTCEVERLTKYPSGAELGTRNPGSPEAACPSRIAAGLGARLCANLRPPLLTHPALRRLLPASRGPRSSWSRWSTLARQPQPNN